MVKDAMELPSRQRLALAELLLGSGDAVAEPEAETSWDAEIRDRVKAIDEGRVTGVAYQDVRQAAQKRLGS